MLSIIIFELEKHKVSEFSNVHLVQFNKYSLDIFLLTLLIEICGWIQDNPVKMRNGKRQMKEKEKWAFTC